MSVMDANIPSPALQSVRIKLSIHEFLLWFYGLLDANHFRSYLQGTKLNAGKLFESGPGTPI